VGKAPSGKIFMHQVPENQVLRLKLYGRAYRSRPPEMGVKAWGENHLWHKIRNDFVVSGLVEPRITVLLGR
jgi:hypothetical protein